MGWVLAAKFWPLLPPLLLGNKLFLWVGATERFLWEKGRCQETHRCHEELIYWDGRISGSQMKSCFTGVKGPVAFGFKLCFLVLRYLCVNLQQESPVLLNL